ncbi:hypothetical protein HA466_0145430 [Hirschfeldia incana]|nr:hypothetical protein HA466_0145430 [Hirschfeldia incana]KAJ0248981.1 hypothetical protein HA466_0145430 [Hirschfeldia incana]KAJ0248982.1 hypothetical protein HA466_0145430 [Hirschfeldia incana]
MASDEREAIKSLGLEEDGSADGGGVPGETDSDDNNQVMPEPDADYLIRKGDELEFSDQGQTTDDNSEIGSNEEKDSVGTTVNSDVLKSR